MRKNEFLTELEDLLLVDDPVKEDQDLTELDEWDSLAKMAVMAYYKKNFGIGIDLNDLKDIKLVSDLINLAGDNISD